MSAYDNLIEFRNRITNDTDYVIFEEDCQLLDRILDDLEQKDKRIAELEKENAVWLFHNIVEKLADYEDLGNIEDFKQLKHELEIYKRALELVLISRKEMLEKQNCFTCSVEKAKIEFLDQARKELKNGKA